MAIVLAYFPLRRRSGAAMLACVALFGVSIIVFGLSRSFVLSMIALTFAGAGDMVSIFVRGTLVQLMTPPEMRGRVSAVNMLFIGASNELGQFESGVTAQWFGAVNAVILGGVGTLVVVGVWALIFPELRRVDRLIVSPQADTEQAAEVDANR
jgi:MFS family permease